MSDLTVFVGRWSEIEMQREGFEPDAPKRALAAHSKAEAIAALKCPKAWFNLHFLKAGKRDVEVSQLCLANPGEVFELHYEEVFRNSRIERIHHWVRLHEVSKLLKSISKRRRLKAKENQISDSETWQERVKEMPRVVMLGKCA